MKVYNLTIHDNTLTCGSVADVLATIEVELESEEILDIHIEVKLMTQEDYDKLPEFDGF